MENVYLLPNTANINKVAVWFKKNSIQIELTTVVIRGYRGYFVEQWVSSREPGTLIVTYTGDESDELETAQLSVLDSSKGVNWPVEFLNYLDFQQNHGTATQTDQGIIFITDLADMDSDLFFVDCPTRDIRTNYHLYMVNYNLKMLGFSSRSATVIAIPSSTVEEKFKSVFHTPDNVPLDYFATQIIAVTQLYLCYFNLFDIENCDGLLCHETLSAIDTWWGVISRVTSVNFKQKGPNCSTSISLLSILGFTMLCKSTFELGGSQFNPPKDLLDVDKVFSCISSFQRFSKIPVTGFFNTETVITLAKWAQTVKENSTFSKDLSKMKNIVKSTVNDFTSSSMKTQNKMTLYDPQNPLNCQNFDQIRSMSLGKKFEFLFNGKGKEFDFIHYINQYDQKRIKKNLNSLDSNKSKSERGLSFTLNHASSVQHLDYFGDDYSMTYEDVYDKRNDQPVESDVDYGHLEGFDYDHDIDGNESSVTTPLNMSDANNDASSIDEIECSDNCQKYHDIEYREFQNRLNRRNSIPLVESEMNIHSIEPLKSNLGNNLARNNSGRYYNHKPNILARNYNTEEDNDNVSHLSSNQVYNNKRQSWITYQNQGLYESKIYNNGLRRVASLPCLLETDSYKEEFFGLRSNTANYITSEVLAMKYLQLKVNYQLEVVQKVSIWKRDAKYLKDEILINSDTKWLEQMIDNGDSLQDNFHGISMNRNISKSSNTTNLINAKNNDYNKVVLKSSELEKKFTNLLESNNRLRYELQTLLRKTNDVESSVAQLRDLKMRALIEKVQKISKKMDHDTGNLTTIACQEEIEPFPSSSSGVIDRVCTRDGKVDWKQVQWDEVAVRPHVLIYIFFRWVAYFVCHTFDNQFIEQQWRQIDKNMTVTKVFKEMYDKGEKLFKAKKED